MKPSLSDKDKLITLIRNYFDEKYIEKIARITGFVKRKSKLQGAIFFYMCVFSAKRDGVVSIENLSGELSFEGVQIKKQSLQDRFNTLASSFLKQLVQEALSKKLIFKKEVSLNKFKRIIISDSTSFQLPEDYLNSYKGFGGGASKAGIKNQYSYNLLSGELIALSVHDATMSDSSYPLQDLCAKDLRIEDLGYFKIDRLRQIEKAGAFFLSRLRFQGHLYTLEKAGFQRINLSKIIRKMRVGEVKTMQVYLCDKEKYPTRLFLEKVSRILGNAKRRKLKSGDNKRKHKISKERLAFCDINAFITNCSEKQLNNKLIRECYSLRWQIEILFKAWKSYLNLDKVRQMKIERFECLHYGCLMLIILSTHLLRYFKQQYLVKHNQEVSELKFFKLISSLRREIKQIIKKGKTAFNGFIDQLEIIIGNTCYKEQRINRLQPLTILKKMA